MLRAAIWPWPRTNKFLQRVPGALPGGDQRHPMGRNRASGGVGGVAGGGGGGGKRVVV